MHRRDVRDRQSLIARRVASISLSVLGCLIFAQPTRAQVNLGPITLGAGMRTSYYHYSPDIGNTADRFPLDSARLYINGPVTSKIKFMFNTEYNGATNAVGILDAVARIELHPMFNVWAGRVLPPSDRANLAGPYYNNHWGVFSDGIQNGHPSVFQGRDNGVVYWGDYFKKRVKVSAGAFDGGTATNKSDVLGAFRVQLDLLDPEDGYYLNSTYYGEKKLLAIAGATQIQAGGTATTIDFLYESKIGDAGVITIEGEFANYNKLGGYDPNYRKSSGTYGLAAYIFPKAMGPGKIQLLGKYAKADFSHSINGATSYNQKTTEFNINYLIKDFNARVMSFYKNTQFTLPGKPDFYQLGIGLQIQM